MTPRKLRIKILTKLAQSNSPTTGVVQNQVVAPPSLDARSVYPNAQRGYDARSASIVYQLADLLNNSLHLATGGKYNIDTLRRISWQISPDMFPSPDQKHLAMFFKKAFTVLLNNGQGFDHTLTPQEIAGKIGELTQSQELSNLSQVNPTGPIGTKITSNLQNTVRNLLRSLAPVA